MNNGTTVTLSLTRHRGPGRSDDEQLHVLPLYILDSTDEHGSTANQWRKVEQGHLEVLTSYPRLCRLRGQPQVSFSARKRNKRQAKLEIQKLQKEKVEDKKQTKLKGKAAKLNKNDVKVTKVEESQPYDVCQNVSISLSNNPNSIIKHKNTKPNKVNKTKSQNSSLKGMKNSAEFRRSEELPSISEWFGKPIEDHWKYRDTTEDDALNALLSELSQVAEEPFNKPFQFVSTFSTKKDPPKTTMTNKDGNHNHSDGTDKEFWSENEELFLNAEVGGVAIALTHGSVFFQVSKREVHSTTSLQRPNRQYPSHIALTFFQHKNLHFWHHGYLEWERKKQDLAKKTTTTSSASEHDYVPILCSHFTKSLLLEKDITTLDCSAYGPDMNPIEYVWTRMETVLQHEYERLAPVMYYLLH